METADTYDILFAGECLDGHAPEAVRTALARLFRADAATLDKLFSGKAQRIKGGVDAATADKYRRAMEGAGARAILRPVPAATAAASDNLTVAPPGGDLLTPQERESPAVAAPDTSHLTVAAVGENLEATSTSSPPPSVDIPGFDIAEVGVNLQTPAEDPAPPVFDESDLSVADGPLDLSDCAPEPAAPPSVAIDHLSLAAQGQDLLTEEERRRETTPAPDTSHLSLAPPTGRENGTS